MTGSALHKFSQWVTRETVGGAFLMVAAALGLIWANSPWSSSYFDFSQWRVGPESLGLNLSLSTWAADGLLALFFIVVGAELKHEFVVGGLRDPRRAAVPIIAAVGGMVVPALVFSSVILLSGDQSALHGWAIPTATDIAFALAVLAVFGRSLPRALRIFLLTLAVVDDLLAIIVIAVFYTSDIDLVMLGGAILCLVLCALLARAHFKIMLLIVPLFVLAWILMHASGVHATVAGVLLGLSLPARPMRGERSSRVHWWVQLLNPVTAACALPIFAFFAAGVRVVDGGIELFGQPVVIAVFLGLVLGKALGVLGAVALVTRFTPLQLGSGLTLRSLLPLGFLTGMGFTVSLLIAELSFPDSAHADGAKIAVLLGTVISAIVAAIILRLDARAVDSP